MPIPLWYIKNKYGTISRLLFTETDSLTYEIKTEDVYEDLKILLSQNSMIIQTS